MSPQCAEISLPPLYFDGVSDSRRKGATGLEWLLEEAAKPEPAKETAPPAGDDAPAVAGDDVAAPEPAAPAEEPEPWAVIGLAAAIPSSPPPDTGPNALVAPIPDSARTLAKSKRDARANPRTAANYEVRYRKGGEAVVARGRNIGRGGMFFETTRFLPAGDVFQAQLAFPDRENRRMSVIAEVIWASHGDPDDKEKTPPGMGVKFLDIDDRDLPFLAALVDTLRDR
jgi:hypothetical protein